MSQIQTLTKQVENLEAQVASLSNLLKDQMRVNLLIFEKLKTVASWQDQQEIQNALVERELWHGGETS